MRGGDIGRLLTALLSHADPLLVPYLALGAFAGIRRAELLRLQWSDITGQPAYIRVRGEIAKTKSKRIIPVSANLDDWLRPWYRPTGKVIPDNVQWKLRHLIKAACEKAGVPWKLNALRHSFASYRLAQLGDAARTALEMGNSPNVIFKHYRELVTAEQSAAYWSIKPNVESKIIPMAEAAASLVRVGTSASAAISRFSESSCGN